MNASSRPVTAPQYQLIRNLLAELAQISEGRAESCRESLNAARVEQKATGELFGPVWNFSVASSSIDALISLKKGEIQLRKAAQNETRPAQADRPEVPAGSYAVPTEAGHLAFYVVDVSKTGFVTLFLQVSDALTEIKPWATARSILAKIEAAGPLEASIAYGKALGVCGRCGRTLTNEESRAAGIGPICRSKF